MRILMQKRITAVIMVDGSDNYDENQDRDYSDESDYE